MVKPNIQINYYSALELPGDATLEDIKKNYRKLALKHHPDRGGAVEKFQAIQAAHEVLEDPVTKAKYDADRRRAGLIPATYPRAGAGTPTAKTPFSASTTSYPPPPRRPPPHTSASTGAGWRPAGTATGSGTTGADRFNNFPQRPAPTSKREPDKANVFTAWQNMNQAKRDAAAREQRQQREQEKQQTPRPQPKGAFGASPSKPRPPPPSRADTRFPTEEDIRAGTSYRPAPAGDFSNGTAWAEFKQTYGAKPGMARSNTTKTPRKTGFDPLSGGDEGQAGSTSNYSSRLRTRSDDARAFPPPATPSAAEKTPRDPVDKVDEDVVFVNSVPRETPYASTTGQQTPASSEKRAGHPSAATQPAKTTPTKQKSSNGTARRPFIVEDSSDDSDTEVESSATTPENNAQPKPDLSSNPFATRPIRTPVAPSSRTASPFKPTAPELDNMFRTHSMNFGSTASGAPAAATVSEQPDLSAEDGRTSNMYGFPFLAFSPPTSPVRSASLPRLKPVAAWAGLGNWAIPSSVKPKSRKRSLHERASHVHESEKNAESFPTTGTVQAQSTNEAKEWNMPKFIIPPFVGASSNEDSRFNIPVDSSTFSSSIPAKSEETINTAFTAEQWAGTFSANNVFAAQAPTRKTASPTRKSSRMQSSNSSLRGASKAAPNGPPPPFAQYAGLATDNAPETPVSPPHEPVKFSADEWAKTMKDSSWAFEPEGLKADATSAGSSRPSSRGNRKASVKAAGVKIPATTPKPATATTVEEEDDKQNADSTAKQQSETGAEDDMMDVEMGEAPPPPKDYTASPAHKKEPKFVKVNASKLRRPSSTTATPSSEGNNNPTLKANLADLTSILTQPTTGAGLSDLADVASTLPFPSKPSFTAPQHTAPQILNLPKLPVAPGIPVKLTRHSWRQHCEAFARYMAKFHDFDRTMLGHFASRRERAVELVDGGVQELESVGGAAWTEYWRAQEEDQRVRVHWGIGCDRHLEAVREFEAVRVRVKALVEGPGLAEM